jgi:ERCC4-related helicase
LTEPSARQVHHPRFGLGTVLVDSGATLVVRFMHGIEEVESGTVEARTSVAGAVGSGIVASPLEACLRVAAGAVRSVNDAWGIFSRSRIALLPHQLWVCHRTLRQWPIRLLIADDVGLGKTIEAGLILWPLLSGGTVRRLLILTPASLVEQWQYRLRTMFDIRLAVYRTDLDTARVDFWNTHNQVVASLPTLRADRTGRHDRLLEAPGWDMVIVDEAHHLNADEKTGRTLGYELVEKLNNQQKITSCIFFTGTPHRGKPYGFWSLMKLLQPDRFDPARSEAEQMPLLREVLIRNAKQKVTDMKGKRLFQPVQQYPETYHYSPEEERFYDLLTGFIQSGKTYALSLEKRTQSRVMLVLIALQKLASSSVAAVRAALSTRLSRLRGIAEDYKKKCEAFDHEQDESSDELDQALREWAAEDSKGLLRLMENEIQSLEVLIAAANEVMEETRIRRVAEVTESRFAGKQVLLFTEYKATQALVVSALMKKHGKERVGFINGDDRLDNVRLPTGEVVSLSSRREDAADKFNNGQISYLVSTEAGGEGIDLQERCSCLIHVDLPWNPMRLHQRVGRLNRYGQTQAVEVVSLRNPDTIESRIWIKLEEKLERIMEAVGSAMDEPEDLLQLVLGMTNGAFFNELFSGGVDVPRERLSKWFDEQTRTFGGQGAIETVKTLVGNCQSFDLSGLDEVPPKDLPDLQPFFLALLNFNGRRPEVDSVEVSFKTPEDWLRTPGVRQRYENLVFDRGAKGREASERVIGVGHQAFDQALRQAMDFSARVASVPGLREPIGVFSIFEKVTERGGQVRSTLFAIEGSRGALRALKDWELLDRVNPLLHGSLKDVRSLPAAPDEVNAWLLDAREAAQRNMALLGEPFRVPDLADFAVLWPSAQ